MTAIDVRITARPDGMDSYPGQQPRMGFFTDTRLTGSRGLAVIRGLRMSSTARTGSECERKRRTGRPDTPHHPR